MAVFEGSSLNHLGQIRMNWVILNRDTDVNLAERTIVEWCNFEINKFGSRADIFSGIKRSEEMES